MPLPPQYLGLHAAAITPALVRFWGSNMGPHTCTGDILPTELFPDQTSLSCVRPSDFHSLSFSFFHVLVSSCQHRWLLGFCASLNLRVSSLSRLSATTNTERQGISLSLCWRGGIEFLAQPTKKCNIEHLSQDKIYWGKCKAVGHLAETFKLGKEPKSPELASKSLGF